MRKTCGAGERKASFFLWLVLFSQRGAGYEILTSSVHVFTTESHLPLAGQAVTYDISFLKLFQTTAPNLLNGRRQKWGMSKRMSHHILQETSILVPIDSGTID